MPTYDLTVAEWLALRYVARRETETNRYPLASQLAPLHSALAKLDPAGEPPSRRDATAKEDAVIVTASAGFPAPPNLSEYLTVRPR